MAYVKTCPACKKQVSSRAERCPHCGDISPQQKIRVSPQAGASQTSMNITIIAGEVNNSVIEDRELRFSKIEDLSLKDDFYCSTCKHYKSIWRDVIIRAILATLLSLIVFFIPNYFGWWAFFSIMFKVICIAVWIALLVKSFESADDKCSNEHVIIAVGGYNPARRINSNFKCKFWEDKKDKGSVLGFK